MVDEQRLAALAKASGGWVAQTNSHYGALVEAGLAEVTDGPDVDGDVFVVITDAGKKWLEASARGEPKLKLVEPAPVEEPVGEERVSDPLQALASAPERRPAIKVTDERSGESVMLHENGRVELPPKAQRLNGAEKPADAPRRRRGRVAAPPPEEVAQAQSLVPFVAAEFDLDDAPWNRPPARKRFGAEKGPITKALRLDELPVGASIHIAATPESPAPHRRYAHHVVQANRRYASPRLDPGGNVMLRPKGKRMVPVYDYERRFRIFKCAEDDPRGPGARIQRVDPSEGGDE